LGVNVVNTPLPVTVTNPSVPPSTVSVGNTAALAAAIAAANAGTPVAFGLLGSGSPDTYSVPIGQRLVIEYISGACSSDPVPVGLLFVTTNGLIIGYSVVPAFVAQTNATGYIGQSVKLYADPGTKVSLPQGAHCTLIVSGRLVAP
jgi:hypothetical protein